MSKPRIAFFINTPLRDLPGIVLTAFELCQQGATCYLVPQAGGYSDIWALAPDFVMLPYFRPYFVQKAEQYVATGIQFGLLDTEGAVWTSMDEYIGTLWKDSSLTRRASLICMWGQELADYIIGKQVFDSDLVAITGCPRFDFYTEPNLSIYRQGNGSQNGNRRSILINTNFTGGNYADLPPDKFVENFAKNFGFTEPEVRRWCDIDVEAVEETSRMASRLARDFPGVDVIIRPHPQERLDTYQAKIENLANLRIVRSGAVAPWILKASAVIQRGCTTALEANLAGIPALSPGWINVPHFYPIPESISVQCPQYDDLKRSLQEIFDGVFQIPQEITATVESLVRKWFFKIDGLSHKRVARSILDRLESRVSPDRRECLKVLYGLHKLSPLRKDSVGKLVRYGLGLPPDWSFRQFKGTAGIEENEQSLKLESIGELVKGISSAKENESPKPVTLKRACESGAYITSKYRGRAIVMDC